MNPSTQWVVVDAQTRPIHSYNDDAYGHTSQRLWVIDGATGISRKNFTPNASDAAWLAELISEQLRDIPELPLTSVLEQLQKRVKTAFQKAVAPMTLDELDELDMPCACLGLVQIHDGLLEIACIGDISIVVSHENGSSEVLTDQASEKFSAKTLQKWRQLLTEHVTPENAWPHLRSTIRSNREAVNQADGYTVIHPHRDWIHLVTVQQRTCTKDMRVLMASDGVWRLVDLFRCHDAASLIETVTQSNWNTVMDDLREREEQDAQCTRYLRVKPSDDATGLLARLQGDPT
jgi:serine/threonine protein phosphatase PrpC